MYGNPIIFIALMRQELNVIDFNFKVKNQINNKKGTHPYVPLIRKKFHERNS